MAKRYHPGVSPATNSPPTRPSDARTLELWHEIFTTGSFTLLSTKRSMNLWPVGMPHAPKMPWKFWKMMVKPLDMGCNSARFSGKNRPNEESCGSMFLYMSCVFLWYIISTAVVSKPWSNISRPGLWHDNHDIKIMKNSGGFLAILPCARRKVLTFQWIFWVPHGVQRVTKPWRASLSADHNGPWWDPMDQWPWLRNLNWRYLPYIRPIF